MNTTVNMNVWGYSALNILINMCYSDNSFYPCSFSLIFSFFWIFSFFPSFSFSFSSLCFVIYLCVFALLYSTYVLKSLYSAVVFFHLQWIWDFPLDKCIFHLTLNSCNTLWNFLPGSNFHFLSFSLHHKALSLWLLRGTVLYRIPMKMEAGS